MVSSHNGTSQFTTLQTRVQTETQEGGQLAINFCDARNKRYEWSTEVLFTVTIYLLVTVIKCFNAYPQSIYPESIKIISL